MAIVKLDDGSVEVRTFTRRGCRTAFARFDGGPWFRCTMAGNVSEAVSAIERLKTREAAGWVLGVPHA